MSDPTRTPSTEGRWDSDRIRRVRRRLVGATLLLLVVLLIVPMLDSDPVIEEHQIQLDIPDSPSMVDTSKADTSKADTAVEKPQGGTQTPPAAAGAPSAPTTQAPASTDMDGSQAELKRLEAQKKVLEAQKKALEEAERAEQKRLEMLKADEQRKREEQKKSEERKKQETAKQDAARKAAEAKKAESAQKPGQSGEKETWVAGGSPKKPLSPKIDETARAVAILEGKSPQPAASKAAESKSYVIQIGAYREKTMLDSYQAKIRALGLTPFTELSTKNGVEQTRLRVGPFKNREAAEAGLRKLGTIGLDGQIVSR